MNKFVLLLFTLLISLPIFAVNDEFAENLPKQLKAPDVYVNYNFESTEKVPIKIKIKENIKSENDLYEGQCVQFKVVKNVLYKDKIIIPRGTIINSNVSLIITTGMNGIPASIVFNNFEIDNIKKSQLTNELEVFGQDRSLFVFPLKWALTPLPPTGSLTNFIKGGHAKISTKKHFTIYYYPDWV